MLIVECIVSFAVGWVVAASIVRRWMHKRRYARTLANIARLERELFGSPASRYAEGMNRALYSAAQAKAANYSSGLTLQGHVDRATLWAQTMYEVKRSLRA